MFLNEIRTTIAQLKVLEQSAANYDPTYPDLEFGKYTNETICEGFVRYFYKDMDLSALTRLPVTPQEADDRRSIVSHFKPTYCSACWRTFKQTESQREYQLRPLCDKCEPHMKQIAAQLRQEIKKIDEKQVQNSFQEFCP